MDIEKLIVKRTHTAYNITTKEATEILKQYGLASSEQSIWRYIKNGDIKAKAPDNPNDKRTGYKLSGAGLYSFIIKRAPAVKVLWETIEQQNPKARKPKSKQAVDQ